MEILNGYLARMAEVVIAHGGTINEFIGDAIFAVYGAPVAHPDHAERAAATALAMQAALVEHQRRARPPRPPGLRDGHRPPHGRGGGGQHRLRAAGEVRGRGQRGQRREPRRERDGGRPGPPHGANAGRAGSAGAGRASDRSPGEGPLRAPHRPRAPGARRPVRARPSGGGAGGRTPGGRRAPAGVLGDRREDRAPRRRDGAPRAPGAGASSTRSWPSPWRR